MSVVDNLEKQIFGRKKRVEILMETILIEAFEEKPLTFQRSAGVL